MRRPTDNDSAIAWLGSCWHAYVCHIHRPGHESAWNVTVRTEMTEPSVTKYGATFLGVVQAAWDEQKHPPKRPYERPCMVSFRANNDSNVFIHYGACLWQASMDALHLETDRRRRGDIKGVRAHAKERGEDWL